MNARLDSVFSLSSMSKAFVFREEEFLLKQSFSQFLHFYLIRSKFNCNSSLFIQFTLELFTVFLLAIGFDFFCAVHWHHDHVFIAVPSAVQAVLPKNRVSLNVFMDKWHFGLCAGNQHSHNLPLISSSVISSFVSTQRS